MRTSILLLVVILLLFVAEFIAAADYTWGGAGTSDDPAWWDDTDASDGNGINSDSSHWNNPVPPDIGGIDQVTIPGGGVIKSKIELEGPSTLSATGGYLYTAGFDIGKNTVGSSFKLDGGQVDAQWFSVYPGSIGIVKNGWLNVRGGSEPLPNRGNGGYIDFIGTTGKLTAPAKDQAFLESKVITGILRIDGIVLSTVNQIVNDKFFEITGTTLELKYQVIKTAVNPDPANLATGVAVTEQLSWVLPDSISGCDLYFGTNPDVSNNSKVIDNKTDQTYDPPGVLSYDTTYYWRVDTYEMGSSTPNVGQVWEFTTQSVPGLVAHWKLDEGEGAGTTAQVGGASASGTLVGCSWISADLAPVPSGTNSAVDFNSNNNDRISTGFTGVSGKQGRTVAAWIKADSIQNNNTTLVSWGGTANGTRYSFRINTSETDGVLGALRLEIAGTYAIGQTDLRDEQWHHVAVTHPAAAGIYEVLFYVDGELELSLSGQGGSNLIINTGADNPVMLGNSFHSVGGYGFDGALDDIRIYDYPLSEAEIEDLYLGTIPRAVEPDPESGTQHVSPAIILNWNAMNTASPIFLFYLGTDSNCNDIISGQDLGVDRFYDLGGLSLEYATQYYWRVDVVENSVTYPGSVWNFTTGGMVSNPVPDDGQNWIDPSGTIRWHGDSWIDSYDVWFGMGDEMILAGNTSKAAMSMSVLAQTLGIDVLAGDTDYYWQIISRDSTGTVLSQGPVWSFRVKPYYGSFKFIVENFDNYPDQDALHAFWQDGSANGTGAAIVNDPLTNVMYFDFDNRREPYRSEARLIFDSGQDWTQFGFSSLDIYIRGSSDNPGEQLYLKLDDGVNQCQVMNPDIDFLMGDDWQTWSVSLSEFSRSGVDLSHIVSMIIGTGNGEFSGNSGQFVLNDILLYPPRCQQKRTKTGDINRDCLVDYADLILMINSWLGSSMLITAEEPNELGLQVWYPFDESSGLTANDLSNNGLIAIIDTNCPSVWNAQGYSLGCIDLSDDSTRIMIPSGAFSSIQEQVTLCFWIYGDASDYPQKVNGIDFSSGQSPPEISLWDSLVWTIDSSASYGNSWNHYAFIKDTMLNTMKIYRNGELIASNLNATGGLSGELAGITYISKIPGSETGTLRVDDLRIYDYALSQNEVVYLALGPESQFLQPLFPMISKMDLTLDGHVDLGDWKYLASDWMESTWW